MRPGRWLIPTFSHCDRFRDPRGHDDPQNFEIDAFIGSVERLVNRLAQLRLAGPDADGAEIVACRDETE